MESQLRGQREKAAAQLFCFLFFSSIDLITAVSLKIYFENSGANWTTIEEIQIINRKNNSV